MRRHAHHAGALLIVLVTATSGEAQEMARKPRVGFVGFQSPGLEWGMLVPYQARLRELGWIEDETITTQYRWADGSLASYPGIVRELVESNVDVLVLPCGPPLRQTRELTRSIPVVARCIDLKDFGREIETPDRPGGGTTGATYFSPAAIPRRLELLRTLVPGLQHVGVLTRPESDWTAHLAHIEAEAGRQGVRLHWAEWGTLADLRPALDRAIENRVGAMLTLGDGMTHYHRHDLFSLAAERRLPVLYDFPMSPSADELGLMSYYPDVGAIFRGVAERVDQILKGGKPGDLPLVRPQTFRFVLNPRAARDLGLVIPEWLRQLAERGTE
jgi:putative tryptophan/tyrosine transport system substrate-binding protein